MREGLIVVATDNRARSFAAWVSVSGNYRNLKTRFETDREIVS